MIWLGLVVMSFVRQRASTPVHARAAVRIAARAFFEDPIFSWIAFHEPERLAVLERVMGAMFDLRSPHGVFVDDLAAPRGTLFVEPPGQRTSPVAEWLAFVPHLVRLVPSFTRIPQRIEFLRRAAAGFATLEAIAKLRPNAPHMYIAVLAVDPSAQRSGIGGQLLRSALAEADAAHVPSHLETAREANLAYYARFGFAVQGRVSEGGAPPVWVMTRPAC